MDPILGQLLLVLAEELGPALIHFIADLIAGKSPLESLASEKLAAIIPEPSKARVALAAAEYADAAAARDARLAAALAPHLRPSIK